MGTENPLLRKTRFKKERRDRGYMPAQGSWESVLVGLKDSFGEDVMGIADSDHWEAIEEKASMDLKRACFEYYLAGRGHRTLAEMVVKSNPNIQAAVSLGTMPVDQMEDLIDRISGTLYENYPTRYKEKVRL